MEPIVLKHLKQKPFHRENAKGAKNDKSGLIWGNSTIFRKNKATKSQKTFSFIP
jgi:hypothetical protein